ncbi:O-antigen ligase family protein (plasmid) [Skermanella sp. TT6]|uniref:O-antigen ligase family protein n=1 Tax=Skermanella cutis TaxID=2775420 RepID=A0ABX7BEF3_9PROT|nr:O-antigen ligase family protein [Skermanella sp. TT6]QQP92766.1 O-antigen ligase family protein [Skermanella sp. TT6]
MSVTITGWVVILVASFLALTRPNAILPLALFFVPFSATSVINISAVSYGLSPAVFLLIVFCGIQAVRGQFLMPIRLSGNHLTGILALVALAAYVIVDLGAGGLLGGLSLFQITQSAFLLFGIGTAVLVSILIHSDKYFLMSIKALLWSGVFVSFWGMVQAVCFYSGIPYPADVFNNSISDYADMFDQRSLNVIRIASVAVEPSFMAFSLLGIFAFSATVVTLRGASASRLQIAAALLSGLTILASTSTTGYFGLAVFGVLLFTRKPIPVLVVGLLTLAAFVIMLAMLPEFQQGVAAMTVNKTASGSFTHRWSTVIEGFEQFAERPWFGWGWGFSTSYSMVTIVLANLGIAGALLMLMAIVMALLGSLLARSQSSSEYEQERVHAVAAEIAFLVSLASCCISGFKYVTLDLWFLWALLLGLQTRLAHAPSSSGISDRDKPAITFSSVSS